MVTCTDHQSQKPNNDSPSIPKSSTALQNRETQLNNPKAKVFSAASPQSSAKASNVVMKS
jgi:hypothetical protein